MSTFRAIDIDTLTETFVISLSDILVVETFVGTRGVQIQVLYDSVVAAVAGTVTTPPPTTPPTTPPYTTTSPYYAVTLSASPVAGGGVSLTDMGPIGNGTYPAGYLVYVVATPNIGAGYQFANWTGADVGLLQFAVTSATNRLTMPAATVALTAVFTFTDPNSYLLLQDGSFVLLQSGDDIII